MSIDLNNDTQEAGLSGSDVSSKVSPAKSEFYEVVAQNNDGTEKVFNYRSNYERKDGDRPFSFKEVRDLSAPSLRSLLLTNEDGLSAEELIEQEYKKNSSDGREQAILLEAMKFGSQSALYERSQKYRDLLLKNKHELNRIADFTPLLLMGGRVVPPIISQGEDLAMTENRYSRRTVKKSYKIIEQARVVDTPLNWRTYLLFDVPAPIVPSKYSLPILGNEREEKIWANGVSQGWEAGLKQANGIYIQNMLKLERDYTGMILFKLMLSKKMITSPITANTKLGVTGDEDTLNVGESIFEIMDSSKFNKNAESWDALPEIRSPIFSYKESQNE